jgi:nanoRNase/pAp phosphatase (c-di-AMP/oligoRNAs hydrolase)
VAARWGGGGHHNAAGCRLKGSLSKATLELEAALCTAIKALK